jgi:biopolymer transport protein ExbB/TolQ
MNIGALLQSAIYIISSSMLYPAMALLVGGFAVTVTSLGGFAAEWAERSRTRARGSIRKISSESDDYAQAVLGVYYAALEDIIEAPDSTWDDVDNLWRAVRRERWARLDYLRILARLGPAMGLVGTLIPMSTGLASLSQGDTSRLSSDLVIAFSTTVVGLCYGVAAYILYTIRARWTEEDLETVKAVIESRASEIARMEDEKR